MKYINYKKFSYLVDEPITFNLYKIMACNEGINNLLGKSFYFIILIFSKYNFFLFKIYLNKTFKHMICVPLKVN